MLGEVARHQFDVIDAQHWLIYGMEAEFNRKLARLERMMDLMGRTLGNPILIEDDPVADAVVAGTVEERE